VSYPVSPLLLHQDAKAGDLRVIGVHFWVDNAGEETLLFPAEARCVHRASADIGLDNHNSAAQTTL